MPEFCLDLHIESCGMRNLTAVSSPTLTSLAIVQPQHPLACAHLRIVAPLLARLRLEIGYDEEDCHCVATGIELQPLALLAVAEASIHLTDTSFNRQPNQRAQKKGKIEFLKSMGAFLAALPNVVKLSLFGFPTTVSTCILHKHISLTIVYRITNISCFRHWSRKNRKNSQFSAA